MEIHTGKGWMSGYISQQDIDHIYREGYPPATGLWEKIKDFFFTTNIRQAMQCIEILSKPEQLTYQQIKHAFDTLEHLAAPGCRKYFNCIIPEQGEDARFTISDGRQHALVDIWCPVENEKFRLARATEQELPREANKMTDSINRLIIFGDSLSDSKGRMYQKTHHILPSYSQYYNGRFTNGFVWSEFLSSPVFLNKETLNFAEGGSTSASYSHLNVIADFLSDLDKQMKAYMPSESDLIICMLGANDYITLHKHDITLVVKQQINDINQILVRGGNNILVMGLPDLSVTPYAKHSDQSDILKHISKTHNSQLKDGILALQKQYPGKKVVYFDTVSAFQDIKRIARAQSYNTSDAYIEHSYIHIPGTRDPALNICPEYIYNDRVHPTQEVHHAFAVMLEHFIVNNWGSS